MKFNPSYQHQKRQNKQQALQFLKDSHAMEEKKDRKKLSKKLRAQRQPGRYVHEVDDEMFNNLCSMLDSVDNDDISLARDILYKSKLVEKHITHLTNNYLYVMRPGYERFRIYSDGNVGIGTTSPSYTLYSSSSTFQTLNTP